MSYEWASLKRVVAAEVPSVQAQDALHGPMVLLAWRPKPRETVQLSLLGQHKNVFSIIKHATFDPWRSTEHTKMWTNRRRNDCAHIEPLSTTGRHWY